MFINLYKTRFLLVLISTILLCQYTKTVNSTVPIEADIAVVSPYLNDSATYFALAKKQEGSEKQSSLLLAAGQLTHDGYWSKASAILTQTTDLTPAQANEKELLLAEIDLIRDRNLEALKKLNHIKEIENLSPYHQLQYHELLAQAYRSTKKYSESVSQRIQLDHLLADEQSRRKNYRLLWLTLNSMTQTELNELTNTAEKRSQNQGWYKLALISQQYRENAKSLLAALDQWQNQFYNHPANQMLPNPLDSITSKLINQPNHIALLLPMTGALSGPGTAIKDGFMAAYKSSKTGDSIQVQVYDTNKGDITSIYQQAITDGADYVVGPLTKNQVAAVANMPHPVPTLFLNEVEANLQDNSYYFGLSPFDEATQVAIKAKSKGYSRALIIAPQSDWGKDVAGAFSKQWQAGGGRIVGSLLYAPKDDLNKKMRDFLQITQSQTREKHLKEILGQDLEVLPSRRQDVDVIFLLAFPSKARQIMPMLKYYYAGDVPVYSTSTVYTGNANAIKDKDLDGIMFCDIPWVFSHQMSAKNWPEQFNSYNRLYALGLDSYALAAQLNHLMLFPTDSNQNTQGSLYLKPSQQVARELEWGQFKQGLAHSIG